MSNSEGKNRIAVLLAQLEQAQLKQEQAERERDEEKREREKAERERDEEKREREQAERKGDIATGEFFATIGDVFEPKKEPFVGAFDLIRRTEGYYESIPIFKKIVDCVKNQTEEGLKPRLESNSSSGNSGSKKNAPNFVGQTGREVGHQIPETNTCSPTYGIVSQAILGFDAEKFVSDEHGGNKDTLIKTLQHLVCGNGIDKTFGLKNVPLNFLMVPKNHVQYYDDSAKWIIVPILTLEQVKDWKDGESYWVMVLAADPEGYKALITADYNDSYRKKCDEADVRIARTLLGDFVKANADALLGRPDEAGKPQSDITPLDLFHCARSDAGRKRNVSKGVQEHNLKGRQVKIPDPAKFSSEWEIMKVHLTEPTTSVHRGKIPDPALVALKASINCSDYFKQKLLPACKKSPVDVLYEDPGDVAALEFYESVCLEQAVRGSEVDISWPVEMVDDDLSEDED